MEVEREYKVSFTFQRIETDSWLTAEHHDSQITSSVLHGHTHRPWRATFSEDAKVLVTVGEV